MFKPKQNIRIMSYNVEGFKKYDAVIKVISDSDANIIGLNEALFFKDDIRKKFTDDVTKMGYNIKMCNNYGINVILSKDKITNCKVIKLCKDPIKNRNRYALKVKTYNIDIVLTHLDAFDSSGNTRDKQIVTIGENIHSDHILMGDFNSIKGSNVINLIESGFTDSFTLSGRNQPESTCWSNRVIDFIFFGRCFPYRPIDSNIVICDASDHYPVYVDF